MIVVPASYSFPTADNTTPRYQDFGMGATDLIRSRDGWAADVQPLVNGSHVLRMDNGSPIYGNYNQTYDDEAIVLE